MAYNPVNPNGQASMANSAPVVIASDQSALPTQLSDGTHTGTIKAASTPSTTSDTAVVVTTRGANTIRIDAASATVTYLGDAIPGTATSAASWRIRKIDTSSGTTINFADGNDNYDNVWDNHASLSYS